MAGFRKAKGEQAVIKMGVYGPPGSGKTLTSLMFGEGLAALTGKRIAYVDTERGTDFYAQAVPGRKVHPAAFDFDALYTKSLTEASAAIRALDFATYGVVVVDSITHLWDAAIAAYEGRQTRAGTIPMQAWGAIKKPYKELIAFLLGCPAHVIICGRQGIVYGEDAGGELKALGTKMRAEGETAYEPHILVKMEAVRSKPNATATITAFAEKDRTGVLAGQVIPNPTYDNVIVPLLPLLGGKQAAVPTESETAARDAETMAADEIQREARSTELYEDFVARFGLAKSAAEVEAVAKGITPEAKAKMLPRHVAEIRERYLERLRTVKAAA